MSAAHWYKIRKSKLRKYQSTVSSAYFLPISWCFLTLIVSYPYFPLASCLFLPTFHFLLLLNTSTEIINKTHNVEERKSKCFQSTFWISKLLSPVRSKEERFCIYWSWITRKNGKNNIKGCYDTIISKHLICIRSIQHLSFLYPGMLFLLVRWCHSSTFK